MPTSVWQRRQNESLGHLHQRYSLVDRSHDVEFPRWNNGRAEGGLGMQIPHCTHPCFKQSILINISCDEKSISQEKVETFLPPQRKALVLFFSFSGTCMCDVIFWATILEKKGDKTSCNNGLKKNQLLFTVWCSWQSEQTEAKCAESPKALGSTNNLAWLLTLIHKPSFMCVLLGNVHPPSFPKPTQLIDGVGDSCTSQYHTALYLTTFIILSFWIISSDGLARMNDTFQRMEQLQPGSSVSWQAPLYATPDRRGLAKCLAKGLH